VVLGGLRQSGSRVLALAGSALVFGLFHINPYHVVSAALIGLLLAYVALESGSIVPGMVVHLINNGLQVLLDRVPAVADWATSPVGLGAAVASTLVGLWWIRGSRAGGWKTGRASAA
jgi:membrane protease YdiL (CAAX protease family)